MPHVPKSNQIFAERLSSAAIAFLSGMFTAHLMSGSAARENLRRTALGSEGAAVGALDV